MTIETQTDLETAIERITVWLRDYGETKSRPFLKDCTILLQSAKACKRLNSEIERLRQQLDGVLSLSHTPIDQTRELVDEVGLAEWIRTRFVHVEDYNAMLERAAIAPVESEATNA